MKRPRVDSGRGQGVSRGDGGGGAVVQEGHHFHSKNKLARAVGRPSFFNGIQFSDRLCK